MIQPPVRYNAKAALGSLLAHYGFDGALGVGEKKKRSRKIVFSSLSKHF